MHEFHCVTSRGHRHFFEVVDPDAVVDTFKTPSTVVMAKNCWRDCSRQLDTQHTCAIRRSPGGNLGFDLASEASRTASLVTKGRSRFGPRSRLAWNGQNTCVSRVGGWFFARFPDDLPTLFVTEVSSTEWVEQRCERSKMTAAASAHAGWGSVGESARKIHYDLGPSRSGSKWARGWNGGVRLKRPIGRTDDGRYMFYYFAHVRTWWTDLETHLQHYMTSFCLFQPFWRAILETLDKGVVVVWRLQLW